MTSLCRAVRSLMLCTGELGFWQCGSRTKAPARWDRIRAGTQACLARVTVLLHTYAYPWSVSSMLCRRTVVCVTQSGRQWHSMVHESCGLAGLAGAVVTTGTSLGTAWASSQHGGRVPRAKSLLEGGGHRASLWVGHSVIPAVFCWSGKHKAPLSFKGKLPRQHLSMRKWEPRCEKRL